MHGRDLHRRPATIPISEWWWLGIVIAVILVIGVAGAVWVDAEVGIHRTSGMMPLNPVPTDAMRATNVDR